MTLMYKDYNNIEIELDFIPSFSIKQTVNIKQRWKSDKHNKIISFI